MKKIIIFLSVIFSVAYATATSYEVSVSNLQANGTIYILGNTGIDSGTVIYSIGTTANIDSGNMCYFYIVPHTGYTIDTVYANGVICSAVMNSYNGTIYQVQITAPTTLLAMCKRITHEITATCDTTFGYLSPIGVCKVNQGDSITFQFIPKPLCALDSLYINGIYFPVPDTASYYTFHNVTADSSIHAVFKLAHIITNITIHGKGYVKLATQYDSVIVRETLIDTFLTDYMNAFFVPDTGYKVDSININGQTSVADNFSILNLTEHQNITAYFGRESYMVSITYGPHGSGSLTNDTAIKYTDTLNLCILPDEGYRVSAIMVNNVNYTLTSPNMLLLPITEESNIYVTFEPIVPAITVICGPHGSVSYEYNDSTITYGQNKQIWFNADKNYTIDSVIVNGKYVGMMDNYTLQNIRGDSVIRVVFASATCTISVTGSQGGTISPAGNITINRGDSLRIVFLPDNGFNIGEVKINNIVRPIFDTCYTFYEIRGDSSIYVNFLGNTHNVILNIIGKGDVTPATTQVVSHGESLTYTFTPHVGQHVDAVYISGRYVGQRITSYTISNIQADSSIRVVFAPDTFQVAVSCTPYGSVTPYGTSLVVYDDSLPCTFVTAAGCDIDSVIVNGRYIGQPSSYTFYHIQGDSSLHVVFKIRTYSVTGTTNNQGIISVDSVNTMPDSVIMNYGENKIFYFIPNIGHHVDSVMVNNYYEGNPSSYTVSNIQENVHIDVKFAVNTFRLIVNVGEHGMASLFDTTICNYGEPQTVHFVPDAHYHVDSVWVNGIFIGIGLSGYQFAGIYGDSLLEVHFTIDSVKLSANSNTNGYMVPSGIIEIPYGGTQEVLFIPYNGNHVDSVFINGTYIGRDTRYVFNNLCADSSIYVAFALDTFALQATAAPNGKIEPSGTLYLPFGSAQTYTITPQIGYLIDSVYINNEYAGSDSNYTFPYISENATIHATFRHQTFNVWAIAHENGSITPGDTSVVIYDDDLELSIIPDEYYKIADVYVDGISVGAVNTYKLTHITQNIIVEAFFTLDSITLTASAGPNGQINPSGTFTVAMGSGMMYSFFPYKGYQIDSVYVNGIYNPQAVIDAGYTFERVKENGNIHVTFASMLSIALSKNDNIHVYATNRQIRIKNPDMKSFKQIAVFDITGRMVAQYTYTTDNMIILNTCLPKGIYIIRMLLQDNSGIITKKVVIK